MKAAVLAHALLLLVAVLALLGACVGCSDPRVIVRTETKEVPVEKIVSVPADLSADCAPAGLASTNEGDVLARLASVEGALACARDHLQRIRGLKLSP